VVSGWYIRRSDGLSPEVVAWHCAWYCASYVASDCWDASEFAGVSAWGVGVGAAVVVGVSGDVFDLGLVLGLELAAVGAGHDVEAAHVSVQMMPMMTRIAATMMAAIA
jgi:hypothetical protein